VAGRILFWSRLLVILGGRGQRLACPLSHVAAWSSFPCFEEGTHAPLFLIILRFLFYIFLRIFDLLLQLFGTHLGGQDDGSYVAFCSFCNPFLSLFRFRDGKTISSSIETFEHAAVQRNLFANLDWRPVLFDCQGRFSRLVISSQ
jgi:hypothetical protein